MELEGCSFSQCSQAGMAFAYNGPSTVQDCQIDQQGGGIGIGLDPYHQVHFENNIVMSDYLCIEVKGSGTPGSTFLHNNHFLAMGDAWYVRNFDQFFIIPDEILDMENNYWGTRDPDEIAARIYDGNDDPEIGYVVDFLPLADGPVSTERVTLDGLKALFR